MVSDTLHTCDANRKQLSFVCYLALLLWWFCCHTVSNCYQILLMCPFYTVVVVVLSPYSVQLLPDPFGVLILHCCCGGGGVMQCITATNSPWCVTLTLLWWYCCCTVSNCRQTQQCRAGTYFDEDRCQCGMSFIHSPSQNNHSNDQRHRHRSHNIINNNK